MNIEIKLIHQGSILHEKLAPIHKVRHTHLTTNYFLFQINLNQTQSFTHILIKSSLD